MAKTIKDAFIHPASRADLFKSKSFTENIITNIIKVCSPKHSFVIDDNDFKSAFYDVTKNSTKVLAMVINGYYVEVPVSEAAGMKAFWVDTEELGYSSDSEFVGMKEAVYTQEGDEKRFVHATNDPSEIPDDPAGQGVLSRGDYLIVSDTGLPSEVTDSYWNSFYSWVLKTKVYSCIYVGPEAGGTEPDHDKLWIVSDNYFIAQVWYKDPSDAEDTGKWVPLGAVYKSTQTT